MKKNTKPLQRARTADEVASDYRKLSIFLWACCAVLMLIISYLVTR